MVHARINAQGRTALAAWLSKNLKSGADFAERWADELINDCDISDPENHKPCIELYSFHTRSGNPEIYAFNCDEFDLVELDEDGNEMEDLS